MNNNIYYIILEELLKNFNLHKNKNETEIRESESSLYVLLDYIISCECKKNYLSYEPNLAIEYIKRLIDEKIICRYFENHFVIYLNDKYYIINKNIILCTLRKIKLKCINEY